MVRAPFHLEHWQVLIWILPVFLVKGFLEFRKTLKQLSQTRHRSACLPRWCIYLRVLCKPLPIPAQVSQRADSL